MSKISVVIILLALAVVFTQSRFINYGGGYYEYDKNQDYYGSLFRPNAFYRKQSIYGADTDSYDRIPFFKRFRTPYYGGY